MLNDNLKKSIAIAFVVLALSILYYGSYLPYKKSHIFIQTMGAIGNTTSVSDFEKKFSTILDIPSPVGQEELVRQLANIILNLAQQTDKQDILRETVRYVESYASPIILRGRGMSFGQDLYILGVLNEVAFVKTSDSKFLVAAEKYFSTAITNGPKRPQALYGMFDVYRAEKNVEGAKTIAKKILEQWPNDERTRLLLAEFLKTATPPAPAKKGK